MCLAKEDACIAKKDTILLHKTQGKIVLGGIHFIAVQEQRNQRLILYFLSKAYRRGRDSAARRQASLMFQLVSVINFVR